MCASPLQIMSKCSIMELPYCSRDTEAGVQCMDYCLCKAA